MKRLCTERKTRVPPFSQGPSLYDWLPEKSYSDVKSNFLKSWEISTITRPQEEKKKHSANTGPYWLILQINSNWLRILFHILTEDSQTYFDSVWRFQSYIYWTLVYLSVVTLTFDCSRWSFFCEVTCESSTILHY